MGAVGAPHFRNAQARHARRTELGLRMDHRDLLVERHLGEGVFHPRLQGLGVIQIDGKVRFLLGGLPARDSDKGKAEEEGSAVHSFSVLITYKDKQNLRKLTSADHNE